MASLSTAGAWLQRSLLALCSNVQSSDIQLDADVTASLVSYCESAPPSDAKEYLNNVIGEENCRDIIAGYLQRRETQGTLNEGDFEDGMQVYVKPQANEIWSAGSKKIIKNLKPKVSESNISSSLSDASNGSELSGPASSKGKSAGGKAKRTGKGISLAEASEGKIIMSRGAPCTCQATRHKLVNNCLSCGRIVCEQEEEGPCNFCGALVLREGSTYAGLEGSNVPMSDSEAAAQAFKDRLVEYGRTSSQRTTVIDDQSDYFQVNESTWLSEEEKQAIIKRQEEVELAEEARKKKVVISIDLLGRKVVMADDTENDVHTHGSILDGSPLIKKSNDIRIKPNPYISKNPVFVNLERHKETDSAGKAPRLGRRPSDMHRNDAFFKTGRVQHDDPFVCALGSISSNGVCEKAIKDTWKAPKLKERVSSFTYEDEGEECLMDCKVKKAAAAVFDICEPQKGKRYTLSPSLLAAKQAQRSQKSDIPAISILRPGMILLKHWLTENDQVKIVQTCKYMGVGPGGFYKPGYGSESKMHLHMMCLGEHWEPMTRSYEMKRSIDNASPPGIPSLFETLAVECLRKAQHAVSEKQKNVLDMVPEMHPTICLVNFYDCSGKLGLHQDRDESQESLKNGTPVVSFSIGDSAEFMYGDERDVDAVETTVLESGDVLIFGGPSRMIYHGVSSIRPRTAPSWLIEKTNLRPGRMNLTFRQS